MLGASLVPVLWLVFLCLTASAVRRHTRLDWGRTGLAVLVVWGLLVWGGSEGLSAFRQLTPRGAAVFWTGSALVLLAIGSGRTAAPGAAGIREAAAAGLPISLRLALVYSAGVAGVLLLTALAAAPNTADSMTYHLSRVMQWQQNRSLAFFPTHNLRQLHAGPWAEMAILQLQLLAESDRLANLVQWVAMCGSAVGASAVARLIGGSRESQALAALVTVTIPMGLLQSTSTQNDYVVALWVICFTAFSLTIIAEGPSVGLAALVGASLGLAALTKATGLVWAAPVGIWLGLNLLRRPPAEAAKFAGVILAVALVVNAGHATRNSRLYGRPLGPMSESPDGVSYKYTNDTYSPASLTSNLIRNAALHAGTSLPRVNAVVVGAVARVHHLMDLDINDPRSTWTGTRFGVRFSAHEDAAGNPLHLALVGLALLVGLRYGGRRAVLLGICAVFSFVLFSFLLKWQPWHSRLQLPFFVLSAPFVAVVLQTALHRRLVALLLAALATGSIPFLLGNASRPLLGPRSVLSSDRTRQYFTNRPGLLAPYEQASALVVASGCTQVGLITGGNDWEYPLWIMTGAGTGDRVLRHMAVTNVSGTIGSPFAPCAVLALGPDHDAVIAYGGSRFKKALQAQYLRGLGSGSVAVYLLEGGGS